jgi:hypothetical protein
MAAHGGKIYPVGMQKANVYLLNTLGMPAASSPTAVYEGVQVEAAKTFELEIPDVRRIAFLGDNQVKASMLLPRQEPTTGTLIVSQSNHAVHALVSGTKAQTVGESSMIGHATSNQGAEPAVLVMCIQPGVDPNGASCFRTNFLLSTRCISAPGSMNDNALEQRYSMSPSQVNHAPWGVHFTAADNGFTEAEIVEVTTFGMPHLCAWLGDNTATKFSFAAGAPAGSTAKIHAVATVDTDGTVTDCTSTATKEVDGVTPAVKPAAGVLVLCFYEE